MNLTDLIHVYPDVFDSADCKQIVQFVDESQASGKDYDTNLYKFHQINVNEVLPDLAKKFASAVKMYSKHYFQSLGFDDYIQPQAFEEVRIKKYTKGVGEFRTHIDVNDLDSAKRYLIGMLYLNDNDGATEFPNLGVSVTPVAGTLVMFPPMWMFPHCGKMPTNNDKYIMMTSLSYTKAQ